MPYVEYDEVEAVCSDCGRAFRSEEALTEHRAEAHSGKEEPAASTARLARVACSVCGKAFPSTAALTRHNAKSHTA